MLDLNSAIGIPNPNERRGYYRSIRVQTQRNTSLLECFPTSHIYSSPQYQSVQNMLFLPTLSFQRLVFLEDLSHVGNSDVLW